MKNTSMLINTLFAASCALLIGSKTFAEPMNLATLKKELVQYQSSGEYDKELASIAQQADQYIVKLAAENKTQKNPQKLAIVLDIDETSLSNYNLLLANNFCIDKPAFDHAIRQANDPAIPSILSLYQHALKSKVAVFFITGRPDSLASDTTKNLKHAGYKGWAGLYLRPSNDNNPSIIPFKSQARQTITQMGYHIIASIGDQESDLAGGLADKTFKLPNPYYFIP